MSKHILFCGRCKKFTMKDACVCKEKTISTRPPKFSLQEKYADYRRQAKRPELEAQKKI